MAGEQYSEEHLVESFINTFLTIPFPGYNPGDEEYDMTKDLINNIAIPVHEHVLSWYGGEGGTPPPFVDEKVKMTGGDPTAGYLAEKIDGVTIQYNNVTNQLFIPPITVNDLWFRDTSNPINFLRPTTLDDHLHIGEINELVTDEGFILNQVRYIDFRLQDGFAHQEGRTYWDDDDKTLITDLEGGTGVSLQHGQELQVRVTNNSGAEIPNGSVVYTSGAQGQRPTIALAQANQPWTSASTLGIVTHDIPNNNSGYVTIIGYVRDVDTSACTDGCLVWLSPTVAGGWTDVAPSAPNTRVVVGIVLYSHATEGVILTESATFQNLSGMPDVTITTGAAKDLLRRDPTNVFWENVSHDDLAADLSYWQRNGTVLSPKTAGDQVSINQTAGGYLDFVGYVDIREDDTQRITIGYPIVTDIRIGHGAGNDTHTQGHLIAIGYGAASAITSSSYTTAIGGNALHNLEAGTYQLGIGYRAGFSTVDGTSSVMIGVDSFEFNVSGSYNVGLGAFTGRYQLGGYNTFLGYYAGGGNSDGVTSTASYNFGLGYQSLYYIETGQSNFAAGHRSLYNLKSGTGNVAIGYFTGINYTSNETYNILIGYDMRGITSDSNHIRIGVFNKSVIEGNTGVGSEWMGTPYEIRTDTLTEYTTDAGISVEANLTTTTGHNIVSNGDFAAIGAWVEESSDAIYIYYSATYGGRIFTKATSAGAYLKTLFGQWNATEGAASINMMTDGKVGILTQTGASQFSVNGTFDTNDTVTFSGLSEDATETYVVAIDNSTGLLSKRAVSGVEMVYPAAGIALSTGSAWGTSITDNSGNWNTAFGWGDHAGLYSLLNHTHPWSEITATPTTLSGYGITDAEPWLDNPSISGYVLSSTSVGVRSWIDISNFVNNYKVMTDVSDTTPGYLSDKVDGTSLDIDTTLHKIHGRMHVVANITARDNIPASQRSIGDTCEIQTTDRGVPETYQLIGGITNSDWTRDNRIMTYDSYYPAIEVERHSTSLLSAGTTNIVVGDITQNISVAVDYVMKRGNVVTKGTVEVQNVDNISNPDIHDRRFKGADVGVTFNTHLSGNLIYLEVIVDNSSGSLVDFHYNMFRVMGSISVAVQEFDFYVSNSGDDSKDGTTEANAWETIGKVNAELGTVITAGDSVGWQRGSTFNDATLDFTDTSGTLDNPISMGAYGVGAKPLFTGLRTLGNNWSHLGSNTWSYDLTSLSPGNVRFLLSDSNKMDMAKSIIRIADSSSSRTEFTDDDLGGSNDDYNGSEVVIRTSNWTWEVRPVTDYAVSGSAGTVTYSPGSYRGLRELSTGNGGYFFQNSRHVLEQNTTQGEWAVEGDTLYMYSTTDPFGLTGDIQISVLDIMVKVHRADYIVIDNLSIEYTNQYGVWARVADNGTVTNCSFSNTIFAIWNHFYPVNPTVSNTTFDDVFNGIHFGHATNPTVLDNTFDDIGLVIGINGYIDNDDNWGYNGINLRSPDGGLIQYNNLEEIGYCGIKAFYVDGNIEIKRNHVKNCGLILIDGGAFYTWSDNHEDKLGALYSDNLAVYDAYSDVRFAQGRHEGETGFTIIGFYKDGYERNIKYHNNFAYGYESLYYANPGSNCEWIDNVGGSPRPKNDDFVTPFRITGTGSFDTTNAIIKNNTFIAIDKGDSYWQRIVFMELDNTLSASGNEMDYNRYIQAAGSWYQNDKIIGYVFDQTGPDKDITEWRADVAIHEGHDQAEIMHMGLSGITDAEEFMWHSVNPTKSVVSISFPSGYRYYDIDGVEVISESLQPYKGKIYFRTIDEGMPQVTIPTFTGNAIVGTTLTSVALSSIYSHEEGNSESGSTYQWYVSGDNTIEGRDPITNATNSTYVPLATDGFDGTKYVILGITPKSAAGTGSLVTGCERFSTPVLVAESADFYLSGSGSDSAAGTSPGTAWETFTKLTAEFLANNILADSHIALERSSIFAGVGLDTHERDGTSGNEIVLTTYGVGDKPIIKGTKELSGTWTEETGLGTNIWSLTDASITNDVRHLIIGGARKPMGQTDPDYLTNKVEMVDVTTLTFHENTPSNDTITDSASGFLAAGFRAGDRLVVRDTTNNNTDYLDILSVTAGTITVESTEDLTDESPAECSLYSKSAIKDTLLGGSDDDWNGAEIVLRSSQWVEEVETVTDYEASSGLLRWDSPFSYQLLSSISVHKYLLQNHWRTLLSGHNPTQGDWAYDSVTDKVYMYSTSEPSTLGTIEISIVDRLVDLSNSNYFKFKNLEFQWDNSRAILAENSTNVEVDGCNFHGGTRAVDFWGNATDGINNKVTNSSFQNLIHAGISYYSQDNAHTVDNTFLNIGVILGGKPGETLGYSQLNSWSRNAIDHNGIDGFSTVQYNNIENVGYCGIRMTNTPDVGFLIDKNYIKNALYTLSDGGAIYLVSTLDGGATDRDVTNNLLEFTYQKSLELYVSSYKAHGIYSDRENDDINFQGNFVMGYLHGMNLSYANNQDNIIQDNIVWAGPTAAGDSQHTRPAAFALGHATNSWGDTTNNEIKNNLFIMTYSPTLQDSISSTFISENSDNPVDWGDYDNDFSGNQHIGLSGNLNPDIPEGTVWLKTVDWPSDPLSVDKWKDEVESGDPVGADELGWTPITYAMSGLSSGEHTQPFFQMNPTKSAVALSLPTGFRYYDTDGVQVTSGTVDPYKGTFLIKTIDEGMPVFSTIIFTGTAEVGETQTAPSKTGIYSHEEGNTESGSEYRWYICPTNSIKDRRPLKRIEADTISFSNANPDTISDSANNFLVKGFAVGDVISIRGSDDNDGTSYTIATVTASTITLSGSDTLNTDTAGDLIVIECTSASTFVPTSTMGFSGTEYLALGMKPKSIAGTGALLEGVEKFSTPKLMGAVALTVVGRIIFNGDAGDVAESNRTPALGKYNNTVIGVNATRSTSTAYARSGTRSTYLSSTASGDVTLRANSYSAAATLYPDIKYRVTIWYYLPSAEDYSGNIVIKTDGPTNGVQTWATQSLVTNAWTKVECDLYYEDDETQVLDIVVNAGSSGALIYFDDMEMGALVSNISSTEEVTNGDCETAAPTINSTAFSTVECTAVRSTDESHGGSYSMKITNTETALNLIYYRGPSNANAGLTAGWYKLSFWQYIPGTPEDWRLSDCGLSHVKADATWINWGLGPFSPEAEWELQECVAYIESAHDYVIGGRFIDTLAAGEGELFLDDFSIRAVTLPSI